MSIIDLINEFADQIPEKCVECGELTNKLPFCNLCGTFNVRAKTSADCAIKLSTQHKNPLSLLDRSIAPEHKGLTQADILVLRYRLSEMVSGTAIETSAEQEFDQKLAPLLRDGMIETQFFDLWLGYWQKILVIINDFDAKINDIEKSGLNSQAGQDFSNLNIAFSGMLRDELKKAIHYLLLNPENLLPVLEYTIFAERCTSNYAWIAAGNCAVRVCMNILKEDPKWPRTIPTHKDIYTGISDDIDEEIRLSERWWKKGHSFESELLHISKESSKIHDFYEALSSVDLAADECDSGDIEYSNGFVEERICQLNLELLELAGKKDISEIDADAWLRIKKHGLFALLNYLEVEFLEAVPTDGIANISRYIAEKQKQQADLLDKISNILSEYDRRIQALERAIERESEIEENRKADLQSSRQKREEEESDRRHQARLLQDAQEQFLTRQISLRQKAEGRYFLSVFTDVFGADAGTYWEGINKK
jgi:hypothetical protein